MQKNLEKKTVLVTGGSGFIGTHLCRELVGNGHEVRVIDVEEAVDSVPGVFYERGDIRDFRHLRRLMEGTDLVYHLAARVSVPFCQENPLESYEVNLQGTVNVLEAMRLENSDHRSHRAPVRLVFSSSSAVYGAGASQGQKLAEESVSFQLLSLYAAQKWGSEQAIRLYRQTYHLESVIFRYFNVYGRGQKVDSPYSGVISTFASLLKAGRPLTLNGGGRQTRDFVFVKDVVRACLGVMDLSSAECDGQAMNLGSGSAVSIRDLAYKMMRAAGVEVELREAPARSGDILHSLADNWMARDRLQWVPQTSLDLGLRELLFKQPQ